MAAKQSGHMATPTDNNSKNLDRIFDKTKTLKGISKQSKTRGELTQKTENGKDLQVHFFLI